MMRFLHKISVFFIFYFFLSSASVVGQYTINGTINASSLSCATFVGVSIIYVGNGIAPASLVMDSDLNLTTCGLSGIQFIVRNNASLIFPDKTNNNLSLPTNSSIVIESGSPGGTIRTVGNCSASDLITIGGVKVASCQGGSLFDFDQIVANGGYNYVNTLLSPICSSSVGSIDVSVFPAPSASTTYKLFTTLVGGTAVSTAVAGATPYNTSINTPLLTTTTILYVEATTGLITTARKPVVVTVNPSNTVTVASFSPSLCVNTAMVNISHTTTGATGIGTVTGLPAGVIASWTSNTITISGTPTTSGAFNYSIPLSGGCGSVNATGTITVNVAPIITTPLVNQLDCEGSFVNLKVLASGTNLSYTWQRKKPTDAAFITIPGGETNTTYPSANEIRIGNVGSAQYPDGTQFQVIVSNGSCQVTSNAATLSVNSISGISPMATNVVLCFGSSYTYTAATNNPANVVSYQWKKSTVTGVWNVVNDGGAYSGATTAALTITGGTPLESAEYRVYITFKNTTTNCSVDSSSRTRLITFLPLLTTPQTTLTDINCTVATGIVAVTVQNATDVYSFDNGLTYQSSNTKSGLMAGNYNIIIKNTAGCLSPMIIVPINPVVTNTWNGIVWSTGLNPVSSQKIVFNSSYNASTDLVGCSCEVQSGTVRFPSGKSLTLTNDLKVTGGSLTFDDLASLIQINNVANSGNINYKRATQGAISNFDYTYWSSPVSPQTLFNVSPSTLGDKFYSFNGVTDNWVQQPSSTVMGKGIGYIIRGPQNFAAPNPPAFYQATFIGVPNNGIISITISTTGEASYLLGNPYPSALDADTFMINNPLLVDGLYFWTHGTKIGVGTANLGSGSLAYTSDDYASYTLTGGAAASSGGAIPTGKIGSGQGFFVTTIGSGTVNFNNTMRVGVGLNVGDNAQFFKTQSNAKATIVEKNRLWLDFYNQQGAFKQALIGYVSGATNDMDRQYDGESFDANEYVDFYSIVNNKNLVIQGRAVPFDSDDKVILGFKTTIAGEFTVKINQVDGLFATQEVFIEDKMLNKIHDLKKAEYTFTTEKGTFDDRFVLFYAVKKAVTTTSKEEGVNKSVLVATTEKEIRITSTSTIDAVRLYDLSGKEIFNKQKINSTELNIRTVRRGSTVYVVKIKLENGQVLTQKVIY
jgi:hypothetical protein